MNEFEAPIVGFRLWYAVEKPWKHPLIHDGRLRSIGSDCLWTSGTVEAHCNNRLPHAAPTLGCDCGLYAYDRLETAKLYEKEFDSRFAGVLVLGAVLLWGRINYAQVAQRYSDQLAVSNLGLRFRAQFGRVLALREDVGATGLAARVHGIPAVREHYLESFAREHGAQIRIRAPARDAGASGLEPGRLEQGLIRGYLDGGFGA